MDKLNLKYFIEFRYPIIVRCTIFEEQCNVSIALGKTSIENEGFNSGIARKWGEGVYPCPNFLVLFFHQVIVPKKVIFYPKLTIFVGFSVIFVIIIIKITKILIKIIMATIIIIISIFFHHTRKTSFLSAGKKGPRCPNWGVGRG